MRKLKWSLALAFGSAMTPVLAQEQPLDQSISVECRAMQGTYAVAQLVDTPDFSGIVAEIVHPDIAIGKPAFTLKMSDEEMTRTGAISKEPVLLEQSRDVPSQRLFAGAPIACALEDVAGNDDMQIIHVDLSAMPAPELQDLAGYLGHFWGAKVDPKALRNVSDFIVIDASMVGVAAMFIMIPLKKL